MANWMNLGQVFKVNARKYPNNLAFADMARRYTFPQANARINRLAHALRGLGLEKGDKISCLLENCVEICELYVAAAKIGVVINPVNFRVHPCDVAYIVDNADSKAFFVHDQFLPVAEEIRPSLPKVKDFFVVGAAAPGYEEYEAFIADKPETEPEADVKPSDTWILMYTSGTTGKPKGVLRSHESHIAFYLINGCDFRYSSRDVVLTVMPLCHINTTYFSFAATYLGGGNVILPAIGFNPREVLAAVDREKITFISLIPTHYSLILAVPAEERARYDVTSLKKLLCSSAPARVEQKIAVMDYFKGVDLYEGYGSTEAGIVTTLRPEDQLRKPGSIGQESSGTDFVRILDADGNDVPVGEIGELYSRGPMMFSGYYKMPEKTAQSMRGEYFSAGDMARRDEEGYYYLADRKNNMIITGGEHVFPSEVEAVLCKHPAVFEAAVIGTPHDKWTEMVVAVIVLAEGKSVGKDEILEFAKPYLAKFKLPKEIHFIRSEDMPRNATGKILHRHLRERFGA